MLNRDTYSRAPQANSLANNGVVEVSEDRSDAALSVLRYELQNFVCDGQYEEGLETVLHTFLLNLGNRSEQPEVWISSFYGRGNSCLLRMDNARALAWYATNSRGALAWSSHSSGGWCRDRPRGSIRASTIASSAGAL